MGGDNMPDYIEEIVEYEERTEDAISEEMDENQDDTEDLHEEDRLTFLFEDERIEEDEVIFAYYDDAYFDATVGVEDENDEDKRIDDILEDLNSTSLDDTKHCPD